MADKILQVAVPPVAANNIVYDTKQAATAPIPVVVGNSTTPQITTTVDTPKLITQLTGVGENSIPNSSLFYRAQSNYLVPDRFSIEYQKPQVDNTFIADLFTKQVTYRRVFQEPQVTSDSYKIFFSKSLVTPAITLDVLSAKFQKFATNLLVSSDVHTAVVSKQLLSAVTYSEELVKIAYLKAASETVLNTDLFKRVVAYKRSFQSTIDATDDFFGLSNIDDDQTARIGKTLVNSATSTDVRRVFIGKTQSSNLDLLEQKFLGLSKSVFSSSTAASQTKLNTGKTLSTPALYSDLAKYSVQKIAIDLGALTDKHSVLAFKQLTTTSTLADVKQVNLQKLLVSSTSNQDQFSRVWQAQKQFAETTNTSTLTNFSVGLVLLQPLLVLEQSAKRSGKALITNFTSSDQALTRVNYNRNFLDTVNSTDDFFGNANIDDDQTARFEKNLINLLLPVDQHSVENFKVLSTSYTAQEKAKLNLNKILQSATNYTDAQSYKLDKALASVYSTLDQAKFNTAKILQDQALAEDSFSRRVAYNRQPIELVTHSDTRTKIVGKNLNTPLTSTEQVATQTNYKRILTSLSSTIELVSKVSRLVKQELVLLPEQVRKQPTKVLATGFLKQDLVQKTPNKVLSSLAVSRESISFFKFGNRIFNDIAATNDSGVINNQGYFADTYVTPGYAGTNTNFS